MQITRYRWTWLLWPVYLFTMIAGWYPSLAFVREWPVLFSEGALAILIVIGFRRGNRRDRMIAAAYLVHCLVRATLSTSLQRATGLRNYVYIRGWQWQFTSITLTLLGATTLAIFVRDLIRDRREKLRMATELEAARAIQQVLIPEYIPQVPNYAIASVYKPFGEVGGDFFQIIPTPTGGVLIAIGDVSGKGMPAAMMVSLLVGTLHALAESTTSPAQLLSGLNRRVLGRNSGGFTTCLILRADTDGTLTIANAGHIAPYLDGHELPVENGLPLGLVAQSAYSESTCRLHPEQQLTLVTDGVVEARSKTRELFGFERTAALSTRSVESIAHTAQSFGQDDDITVLTLNLQTLHP